MLEICVSIKLSRYNKNIIEVSFSFPILELIVLLNLSLQENTNEFPFKEFGNSR